MDKFMRRSRWLAPLAFVVAALAACSGDSPVGTAKPELPGNPPIPPQYRGAAFIMDVSATRKTVRITAPSGSINKPSSSLLHLDVKPGSVTKPSQSLLGGDVIELTATNYVAGAVGAAVPGKVLITFDLAVNNKLGGIQLITPTFPTPPAGTTGALLFPFEISVTTTSGGVNTIGNEVIVQSPRFGAVTPSNDWDGNDHNFFNDVGCTATSNDCFRYEPFGTVAPLGASAARKVGFLIDPTVGDFRVKMIAAADLQSTATPTPGTVAGSVTSNIGALNNVTVNVSGGFTGTTDASGAYSIGGVATGSRSVSLANLPSGCVAPAAQTVTVSTGATATANFTVTCSVPTGTISGTISSSLGGGLSGVQVTVTPTGGSALPASTTAAAGTYSVTNVPTTPATGSITLANLPANCTNPGAQAYSGLTVAGLTKDITVTCTAAPVTYPFTATWGPITATGPTGRQATIIFAIDMGAAPGRPDIAGANADPLASISFSVGFDGTKLAYASRTALSPDEFDIATVGATGVGTAGAAANVAVASSSGLTKTGAFQLVRLTLNINAGVTGNFTPTINVTEALATNSLTNVTSTVAVQTAPTLAIP